MKRLTVIVLIVIFFVNANRAAAICDGHLITDRIFTSYNRDIRPVRDQTTPTVIKNEQDESISLLVWMKSTWRDEFLTWNTADPSQDCTSIKMRANSLWTPNVIFTNSLNVEPIVPSDQQWLELKNDGTVSMTTPAFVTLRCTMKITDFPFDTQKCPLNVTVWTYEYKDLQLILDPPTTSAADILSNTSEFQTISLDVIPALATDGDYKFSELHYTLVLKRIPDYYVFVMIIPTFLLTSLCIIGIFIPSSNNNDRGEKVTLGLTTLLTMAIILNIATDQMPKSSEGLPLLGYFILYEIGMCTLAIVLSTALIFVHQKAHTRAWNAPRILYRLTQTQPTRNNAIFPSDPDKAFTKCENSPAIKSVIQAEHTGFENVLGLAKESGEKLEAIRSLLEKYISAEERRETTEMIWLKTLDLIDIFLLIILLIANTVIVCLTLL